MDIDEGEMWSQSTIDGLGGEYDCGGHEEKRWQVDTAIKIREMMSIFHKRCVLCWVKKMSAKHEL